MNCTPKHRKSTSRNCRHLPSARWASGLCRRKSKRIVANERKKRLPLTYDQHYCTCNVFGLMNPLFPIAGFQGICGDFSRDTFHVESLGESGYLRCRLQAYVNPDTLCFVIGTINASLLSFSQAKTTAKRANCTSPPQSNRIQSTKPVMTRPSNMLTRSRLMPSDRIRRKNHTKRKRATWNSSKKNCAKYKRNARSVSNTKQSLRT